MLQATYRAAKHGWANVRTAPGLRRKWQQALNRCLALDGDDNHDIGGKVTLSFWLLAANGGARIRGWLAEQGRRRAIWVKYYQQARPEDVQLTCQRVDTWRKRHPELAGQVPAIMACIPEERCLAFESIAGEALDRYAPWQTRSIDPEQLRRAGRLMEDVGDWLNRFAWHWRLGPTELPIFLDSHCQLNDDGMVRTSTWRHLKRRITQGDQAARQLKLGGLTIAEDWKSRFDLDWLARSCDHPDVAGLVHGDLTLDNLLVNDRDHAVIDWWMAPVFGIPWADLGMLVASLRLHMPADWRMLADALLTGYAPDGLPARARVAIDLIATVWLMRMAVEGARQSSLLRLLGKQFWHELIRETLCKPLLSV